MLVRLCLEKSPRKTYGQDAALAGEYIYSMPGCYTRELEPPFIVAVADGVGGLPGGREAALFLTQGLLACPLDIDEQGLKEFMLMLNQALVDYAAAHPGMESMASTLSGIIYRGAEPGLYFHAGNTRIWARQGDTLVQESPDHTRVAELLRRGLVEEAARAPKNEIVSCFGGGDSRFLSYLETAPLPAAEGYVLTSDGLHDYLEGESLLRPIGEKPEFFTLARALGSNDDLTWVGLYTDEDNSPEQAGAGQETRVEPGEDL